MGPGAFNVLVFFLTGPGPKSPRKGAPANPVVHDPASTGLEKWEAAVGERVSEDFLQTVVLADPRFPAAHRQSVDSALAYSQGHAAFQATVSDMGQYFLCSLAIYMDVSGGLTHRRIRALMGDTGILSAGRASALLWRLRMGKFIEPLDSDAGKGLTKRFAPTQTLADAFHERLWLDFRALETLEPAVAPLLARFREPEVFSLIIRLMGDDMISSATRMDPRLTALHDIGARSAGILIMYDLAASVPGDGAFPACGQVTSSVAGLSRKFGVSRSHVLSLLRQMEATGFITFDTASGRPAIQPPLRDALRRFQGLIATGQLRVAHRVLVMLRQETAD